MKMRVKVTALVDRPSMNLSKGDSMELELEGDALTALYSEESAGLIKVEDIPHMLTFQVCPAFTPVIEERLKEVMEYNKEHLGVERSMEDTAVSLLYDALYLKTEKIRKDREFRETYYSQGED